MNIIKRIKIENIKGIKSKEWKFENLNANQPNLVVAPNGYGKSTITTAFKASKNGKIKIDKNDCYENDIKNIPSLEVEFYGDFSRTLVSDASIGDISKNVFIYTIESPLYAKSTSRKFGGNTISTADLRMKDIVVYDKIPEKIQLQYQFIEFVKRYKEKRNLFININTMLLNMKNILILLEIKDVIEKCTKGKKINKKIQEYINSCNSNEINSNRFNLEEVYNFFEGEHIIKIFDSVKNMLEKPKNWCDKDIIFTSFQLVELFKEEFSLKKLKEVYNYLKFKYYKTLLNDRLKFFNTTGRSIKVKESKGKLLINFLRANSMSNGERDVLYFISSITKFEIEFEKKVGVLVIDEVFDYLDGCNMLAVQYYLTELINKCRLEEKILFPLIFTHLDPNMFSNYYFNKKKIHYISISGDFDEESELARLLKIRSDNLIDSEQKKEIEKYYIHFNDIDYNLSRETSNILSNTFSKSSNIFKQELYDEVELKYLNNQEYDPLKVVAALRIKIEENVYSLLSDEYKGEFLEIHTVKKKLDFAVEKGCFVPEYYYLLQPLYNDSLHITEMTIKNKLKSCYLKTNSLHIKNLIFKVFKQCT